ncbi:predicted protein [Thalassiosira pseudonana CCMP1335]|uniref:RING-type E3 ubiquitin transferase n=1 Tax=Thalassiosira pseudonana TaxID=35128 RepID=B8C0K8_THAPS|nr:predicted protein [Thalassiosira pseudonana CCMP1335]EED93082.1 predicted protein [Thalassiosira pseudonana CCMP1335]
MPASAEDYNDPYLDDGSDNDDEEEDECRVCRGPAEVGLSNLMAGGDKRRCYIYHGWMVKIRGVGERWEDWDLVKRDVVGGVVIALIVVVSFLSLMSLAEFLRFQWGGEGGGEGVGGGQRQQQQQRRPGFPRRRRDNGGGDDRGNRREGPPPIEGAIDAIVQPTGQFENNNNGSDQMDGEIDDAQLKGTFEGLKMQEELGERLVMQMIRGDSGVNNSLRRIKLGGANENAQNDALEADQQWIEQNGAAAVDDAGEAGELNRNDNAEEDPIENEVPPPLDANDEDDIFEAFLRAQEEQAVEDEEHQQQQMEDRDEVQQEPIFPPREDRQNRRPRDDARFEPQFEPLQPAFGFERNDQDEDDGIDMEVNLALDELLGFRGPVLALVRNLLWLLIFNTAYLGVFAFMPSTFGSGFFALLSKIPMLSSFVSSIPGTSKLLSVFVALDEKSRESNMIFLPSQIAKIGVGYLAASCTTFLFSAVVSFASREQATVTDGERENVERPRGVADNFPIEQDEFFRQNMRNERDEAVQQIAELEAAGAVRIRLSVVLECASAIAKVVILLCIKMLLLPLSLGICLDMTTLPLFDKTLDDRIAYAGTDLFGSIFLHWVSGITFMLLVTVSVLQLREVVHPEILARVIRPQEPQPDLLGNLLQENGPTHAKRILLSLGIYAALLTLHIWLPSHLLVSFNLGKKLPFFRPKLWHFFMPQIQVPAELFLFHLCMLSILEKYKNNIGALQHHWLRVMGSLLGMSDKVLPREVDQFELVGCIPVFAATEDDADAKPSASTKGSSNIDPFWTELLSTVDTTKREAIIRSKVSSMDRAAKPTIRLDTVTRPDGKKDVSRYSFIRFPSTSSDSNRVSKSSDETNSHLLPACVGPYRLKQAVLQKSTKSTHVTVIEIWREMPGKLIPRPPEGWDDLGIGGAESQGRWAWGDEHLSEVESSVAVRHPFYYDSDSKAAKMRGAVQFTAKMATLLFISWMAITVLLCVALNIPLYLGHFAFHLLRVPERCFHDPLAFAIGIGLMLPMIGVASNVCSSVSNEGLKGVLLLPWNWIRSFKPHQSRAKVIALTSFFVLWCVVCPLLLGSLYVTFFVGFNAQWLTSGLHENAFSLLASWATGTMLLNSWAAMCYFKMFTKDFWADLAVGDGQGNANGANANGVVQGAARRGAANNAPANAANAVGQGNDALRDTQDRCLTWQGEDGSFGCCYNSIKAFASSWEWDKVDTKALLQDCVVPIVRNLLVAMLVPLLATPLVIFVYLAINESSKLLEGMTEDQSTCTVLFRVFAISSVIVQFLNSSKHSLGKWYDAAHKIARDDRYLIGEILLNYEAPVPFTAS